jgi:PAS domain S-box-containing protein
MDRLALLPQNFYQQVVESLDDYAVITVNLEGKITSWNPGAVNLLGWRADEVLGGPIDRIFEPADRRTRVAQREMKTALAKGRSADERRHVRKDGALFWASGLMFPIFDERRRPVGLVKILRDRSALKRMEEILVASETQLRTVIDTLPGLVAYVDRDQRYVFCSRTYEDWFGLRSEELVGRTVREVIGPAAHDQIGLQLAAALAGHRVEYESELAYPRGPRWVRATYVPVLDPDKRVAGFVSLVLDISRVKRIEEELNAANKILRGRLEESSREISASSSRLSQFSAMIERAHDAIICTDLDFRITYWNHGAEETYGYTRQEALGRKTHDLLRTVFPGGRDEILEGFRTANHWEGELRHRHRDGREMIVASRWILHREDGQPSAILEINRDVTRLRRTVEELERSNRELEEFARFASHDLQEPLRTISIQAQLLESLHETPQKMKDTVDRIVSGTRRMKRLVDDLLAYSRSRTADVPAREIDLGLTLEEVAADLAQEAAESGAEFVFEPLPTVLGHPAQLREVFRHLIGNALTYREPGRKPRIRVWATRLDRAWRVHVEDNGIGVPPEYREAIFRPFKRLHRKEKHPGTGIGLAICKRIIEAHGGEIGVEAAEGGGSVFWVTLPALENR